MECHLTQEVNPTGNPSSLVLQSDIHSILLASFLLLLKPTPGILTSRAHALFLSWPCWDKTTNLGSNPAHTPQARHQADTSL